MIAVRQSDQRGHADHGWLDTRHTFSFADYYDPAEMGWGPLRVINEDRVRSAMGFGTHGHRDMEIISVVLDGALQHRDNMGNGAVIRAGEVQRMSAGSGVLHSEFNASGQHPVHFLQIWIEPNVRGIKPEYEQKLFAPQGKTGALRVVASGDGRDGSLTIHQDAAVHLGAFAEGDRAEYALAPGRLAYVHVVRGRIALNGHELTEGDGAKVADERALSILARGDAQVLLFDLPPRH